VIHPQGDPADDEERDPAQIAFLAVPYTHPSWQPSDSDMLSPLSVLTRA
jgi:hypothetical protein